MQPKVVRYSQGAAEGCYHEVVHTSPKKLEKIRALLHMNGIKLRNFDIDVRRKEEQR